ncbi:MAG: response regulator [Steroidobacteraceae bacterium]|jgi:two-component system response regulator FixJ|nr:response regulator [Steroidobacteraceae bacterium]
MSTRSAELPLDFAVPSSTLVCVADGDAGVREGVRALLGTLGADVHGYATGGELLASLEVELPACVIADVSLPDMSGLELMAELRRRGIRVPTILLSSDAEVSGAVDAMRAGALDFIEKPYVDRALLNQVAPLLK